MAHYVPPSITYWKVIFFRCLEYKKVSEEENFNSPEMPLDVFSGQTGMFGREGNGRGNLVPEEGVEPSRPCGHGILSRIKKGRKS
jgi:hypothetical protein